MDETTKTLPRLFALLALLHCLACTPIAPQEIAELKRPVDCQTASIDTHLLLHQRPHLVDRFAQGLLCVLPPVVISDLIQGQYEHRVAVASGRYNDLLSHKIKQYYDRCGVQRVVYR